MCKNTFSFATSATLSHKLVPHHSVDLHDRYCEACQAGNCDTWAINTQREMNEVLLKYTNGCSAPLEDTPMAVTMFNALATTLQMEHCVAYDDDEQPIEWVTLYFKTYALDERTADNTVCVLFPRGKGRFQAFTDYVPDDGGAVYDHLKICMRPDDANHGDWTYKEFIDRLEAAGDTAAAQLVIDNK